MPSSRFAAHEDIEVSKSRFIEFYQQPDAQQQVVAKTEWSN